VQSKKETACFVFALSGGRSAEKGLLKPNYSGTLKTTVREDIYNFNRFIICHIDKKV
jgi:hypothetical protein